MLLFDEADSLFGNRSKINDGRGGYANTESCFPLQRLEPHMSFATIATNLEGRIDQALLQGRGSRCRITGPGPDDRRGLAGCRPSPTRPLEVFIVLT